MSDRMTIAPGFEKDPFRRPKHKVLVSDDGGRSFTILGDTDQPLEMLKLQLEGQHAVGFSGAQTCIVDEQSVVVADYPAYAVEPDAGPPDERRIALRNRWLDAVMKFLLPPRLWEKKEKPEAQPTLTRWFRRKHIQIEMRPDGGAVRVWRKGNLLTSWGC